MRRCRLHLTGASGTGTTSLARVIAAAWSVPHADADDYFWLPTSPPFTHKRPEHERLALMEAVFVPRDTWVLSGSMLDWGDPVVAHCDAVVFLTLDPAVRMARIEARERVRRDGGKLDEESHATFLAWARGYDDPAFEGRSRVRHDHWLATLNCPVLHLDSDAPLETLRDEVLRWEP